MKWVAALVGEFLPSLLPAVSAFANPWVWGAFAVALIVAFSTGWQVESWRWDAANTAVLENNLKIISAFWKRQAEGNADTARRLAADREKLDADRLAFDEELANAEPASLVEVSCPKPQPARTPAQRNALAAAPLPDAAPAPAAPGPRVELSAAGCKLFNDGLAVGLPDAYGGWRADAEAACTGPVEITEVLRINRANAEITNTLRSRLLAWQAKACKEGWWKGSECDR